MTFLPDEMVRRPAKLRAAGIGYEAAIHCDAPEDFEELFGNA
jgi:hypothetical protein